MNIDETCGCGARFLLVACESAPTQAFSAAETWRKTHVHQASGTEPQPQPARPREGDFTSYPVGFVKEDS